MTFADIPSGMAIFLDANTFVYHLIAHPVFGPPCTDLLDRIEHQAFQGFSSSQVLGEMAHRLMTLEAQQLFGWPASGMAHRLKRHPAEVQKLTWHRRGIDEVRAIGIHLLAIEGSDVSQAADVSIQFGLLTNDALIVQIMQQHRLSHLASLDADFDRVTGITRFSPV